MHAIQIKGSKREHKRRRSETGLMQRGESPIDDTVTFHKRKKGKGQYGRADSGLLINSLLFFSRVSLAKCGPSQQVSCLVRKNRDIIKHTLWKGQRLRPAINKCAPESIIFYSKPTTEQTMTLCWAL